MRSFIEMSLYKSSVFYVIAGSTETLANLRNPLT